MNTRMKSSMSKQFLSLRMAVFTGAALVLLSGCKQEEKEKVPIVTVQTTAVSRGPISQTITAEAVVYPLQQAVLTPKITSTIRNFLVQRGSRVKKGQLLAVLENADLSAAAEQSKGEFEQAEAGYATTTGSSLPQQMQKAELDAVSSKASYDAQQKMYDSRKELFQQGALPRRDLDSAEVALAQARSQYEQAQRQLADLRRSGKEQALKSAGGQLSAAKGKYLGAQALLSYSEIRSPIDGVVTDRPQFPGELAAANQPLLTVMNTSRLIAKAHIAQSEAALMKVGNPAQLKMPGVDEAVEGRVTLVSPALDPGSTTIEVWVEASKPGSALKPGMSVQMLVSSKSVKDALLVPATAVYKNAEGAEYVLLAGADEKAHVKVVQTGIRNAEFAQIASGLKEGEAVVASGGYALPDNTQIKVEAAAEKPGGKDADEKDAGEKDAKDAGRSASGKPVEKDKE
jgi:HlyD family secretion protein